MCLRGRDGIRRIVLVGSGHAWSTIDVQRGLLEGFQRAGFQVFPYDLHTRIDAAEEWVRYAATVVAPRAGFEAPPLDWSPPPEDVVYQAGLGCVTEALRVNADAVVVVCGLLIDPRIYVLLQRAGFPVFLYGTESPYDDQQFAVGASLVTAASVNEPASIDLVRAMLGAEGGPARTDVPIEYLPLGFNPAIHRPGWGEKSDDLPRHDVVFVGNLYPSRQAFFEAIDWSDTDLGIYGVTATVASGAPVRAHVRRDGPIPNVVAAGLYTRARIVLNLFRTEQFGQGWEILRDDVRGEAVSPRLIEAAALGAFVISEEREQVRDVFGDLIPTFRSPGEAAALIRRWLADDRGRAEVAAKLPAAVAAYSYEIRAGQIIESLQRAIAAQH